MPRRFEDLRTSTAKENPFWIAHGILPRGGILLLGGYAKIGKSFLMLDLADCVATGQPLWGTPEFFIPEPATVLYTDFEIGEIALGERVKERYGTRACPENIYYLSRPRIFLDTAEGAAVLNKEIIDCGAKIVIIDPLSRAMLGQENDSSDVGRLFRSIDSLLADHPDLSIVLAHHLGKPSKNEDEETLDPFSPYRLRGSSRFFDAPDALAIVHPSGEQLKIAFQLRQAANPEPIYLQMGENGIIRPAGGLKAARALAKKLAV